jgi:hypothetical protein
MSASEIEHTMNLRKKRLGNVEDLLIRPEIDTTKEKEPRWLNYYLKFLNSIDQDDLMTMLQALSDKQKHSAYTL